MAKNLALPKITLPPLRKAIFAVFLGIFLFSSGYVLGTRGVSLGVDKEGGVTIVRDIPIGRENVNFSLFWSVWDTLDNFYFDRSKLDARKMVYGAIAGMVAAIGDPYTVFLPPSENKVTQENLTGSFEGVGIQIGFKGTRLSVIAPLEGSPAETAGIKAGDYIVAIKDEGAKIDKGTDGMSLSEAVQIIRGKAGTKVTLALLREGVDEEIVKDIVRERIDVPSVVLSFVGEEGKIAHIKLSKFSAETNEEWDKVVSETVANSTEAIILDLRNNPGGYLDSAVDLASEFLPKGTKVVVEERGNGKKTEFKAEKTGKLLKAKVAVLVNKGTASASEILAGALKDAKKARLVGEATFGKGTIQEPQQIDNGAGLHITIAKWLTPAGEWVNEKGLEPDVKIVDDEETSEDEQLQEAIKILK